jgi:uncharacterized protein (TIGR02722 family)
MVKCLKFVFLACFSVVLFAGCGAAVQRIDTEKVVDLSGYWNDTDSRLVAEEMLKDCLNRPWLTAFKTQYKKEPVVIVGTVLNRSSEHIDSMIFTKDLERELINSGLVKFVASNDERNEVRNERADQATNSRAETAKAARQETGSDFMLKGTINSVKDEIRGKYAVLYQVNLELINMRDNEKVWIGQKEIKKFVKSSKIKF